MLIDQVPEISSDLIWSALVRQPGLGVMIASHDRRYLYGNAQAGLMFFGDADFKFDGASLDDLHAPEFVEERYRLVARIRESGDPLILRHIRRGKQLQSTLWPLKANEENSGASVLIVTRHGAAPWIDHITIEVVESKYADFGHLDVLTNRELEVLALLGEGKTIGEIGAELHRSVKTIEKHRDSIARKLDVRSRVHLAKIARDAGLELRDAQLERLS